MIVVYNLNWSKSKGVGKACKTVWTMESNYIIKNNNNNKDTNLGLCIVYFLEHGLHYQLKWIWDDHSRPS